MKLHLLSDLHLEFSTFEPPATDADVIVLSGDNGKGNKGGRIRNSVCEVGLFTASI